MIGELSLRCWWPLHLADNYQAYRYDPETGYRLKESLYLLSTTDFQREIRSNKDGITNYQEDFSPYKTLIFAVGDSFTQGSGVPADASYPFQLDLLLNTKAGTYHPNYAVVNLGVAGYGTEQELLRLNRYAHKFGNPQYILLLVNETDYEDDLNFKSGALRQKPLEGNPNYHPFILQSLLWFKYDLEIGKRIMLMVKTLRGNNFRAELREKRQRVNYAQLLEPVLQKFILASHDMKSTLILGWTPCFFSPEIPPEYERLKAFAASNNVAFADWYPLVLSVLNNQPGLTATNPHSCGHFRTWVNQMIARAYAEHIKEWGDPFNTSATSDSNDIAGSEP